MPYYDDDGNELDPSTIPIPALCLICEKKDNLHEEILCNLNRLDQQRAKEFKCGAFENIYGVLEEDAVE